MEPVIHPIPPLYDENSRILILGSFPSVKSREGRFFYNHPQNRFWKVTAAVTGAPLPETIPEKREFLLSHNIALWDVLHSCTIKGSSDTSIKNAVPNDLTEILNKADIRQIFCNGTTAYKYFQKFQEKTLGREAICLPSTSPANAAFTLPHLVENWSVIAEYLD